MRRYNGDESVMSHVKGFERRVESFVKNLFAGYEPPKYDMNSKVINDPVWGSIYFTNHEIKVLDSPIMQRLRDISQVGLAVLTYPSARHSRFEHSLGVFHIAAEMVNNINKRATTKKICERDFSMIKLAALLHDVGHCYHSHLSEQAYGYMQEFNELKEHPLFKDYKRSQPHEIFAYFIINSNTFKEFFKKTNPGIPNIDDDFFDTIGRMIVGYPVEDIDPDSKHPMVKNFMTNIINGSFDADKLDYIKRDTYFGGLFLNYDIERFLYRIRLKDEIKEIDGQETKFINLVISLTGVTAIEEMAFCKIMLTSYIYFHQKVLAADAILNDFSMQLIRKKIVEHPCDFLEYTDKNVIDKPFLDDEIDIGTSKKFRDLLKNVERRVLPKRALVIKAIYIKQINRDGTEDKTGYQENYKLFITQLNEASKNNSALKESFDLISDQVEFNLLEKKWDLTALAVTNKGNIEEQTKKLDEMREGIYNIAVKIIEELETKDPELCKSIHSFDKYDIYICFRDQPSFSDADITVFDYDNEPQSLNDIMPLGEWTNAFATNKWSGFIFAREDLIHIVNIAARKYIEKEFGIILKDESRYSYLKFLTVKRINEIDRAIDIEEVLKS